MTAREKLTPPGPSDSDDPPDLIEDNDPEGALNRTDPDKPLLDHQNPDAGIKEISQPDNSGARR